MSLIDLRDISISVNNTTEGTISPSEDMDIVVTNGTNPIVPDTIVISGNTITITILP